MNERLAENAIATLELCLSYLKDCEGVDDTTLNKLKELIEKIKASETGIQSASDTPTR